MVARAERVLDQEIDDDPGKYRGAQPGVVQEGTKTRTRLTQTNQPQVISRYRQRGGNRSRTVADFLIGAHAMMQCDALITRDAGFYRDYFKGLKVIVPKA